MRETGAKGGTYPAWGTTYRFHRMIEVTRRWIEQKDEWIWHGQCTFKNYVAFRLDQWFDQSWFFVASITRRGSPNRHKKMCLDRLCSLRLTPTALPRTWVFSLAPHLPCFLGSCIFAFLYPLDRRPFLFLLCLPCDMLYNGREKTGEDAQKKKKKCVSDQSSSSK